ncbi:MAG: helix-turn-helix domain-containing protein [Myxococcota bacterium]
MDERHSTYYDVLELGADATQEQIDAAYERLTSFLASDSLVIYSLVDDDEVSAQRQTLERAHQTLSDPGARAAYDRQLVEHEAHAFAGPVVPERTQTGTWSVGERTPAPSARGTRRVTSEQAPPHKVPSRRLTPTLDLEVNDDTEFSGSLLRRLRESAGATLEELADITKINRRYVRALEEHDFDNLPAKVYVRGFVSEYARALGLDGQRVATSYMTVYRRYREGTGDR